MNVRLLFALVWFPFAAQAQGFAGLGTSAEGFSVPQRGYEISLPYDYGPHPDFRVEWWYVTANLSDEDGREYGVQWTLFRSALEPQAAQDWASPQFWMGHAALTTQDRQFADQRFARWGIGQAGASDQRLEAWIDEWTLSDTRMTASGKEFAYDLTLEAKGPIVFHGDQGYSVKSGEGQASYYFSQPAFEVSGTVLLPEGEEAVNGIAWFDREWSSQPLAEEQTGWDWFSLSFDSGEKLMGFRLRGSEDYTQATWIMPDGASSSLPNGAFEAEPLEVSKTSGPDTPTKWRVTLPERELDVVVTAVNPDSWLDFDVPYWEGPVRVEGSHAGRGFLEMTGY